ncbi:MAG: hypothetical protein NT018_08555 [Armatimonadetes bacterium]|nr:hypothetical protein [Armatimonadota bacterium]
MPSSPITVITYALLAIGFAAFMAWVVVRNFASDAPFLFDIPNVDKDVKRTKWQQIIHAIRCVVYALIWLVLVVIAFFLPIGIADIGGASLEISDWAGFSILGLMFCIWIAVLIKKVSLRWPLTIIGLIFIPIGGFVMTVVGAIGLGKLIIMSNGRWNVFAGSKLRADNLRAKPRGLVEVQEND